MYELSILGIIFIITVTIVRFVPPHTLPNSTRVLCFWGGLFYGFGLIAIDLGEDTIGRTLWAIGIVITLLYIIKHKSDSINKVIESAIGKRSQGK